MGDPRLTEPASTLAWSLMSELGVPGAGRHHQHCAVDPEPIIVAMPSLFGADLRLRDQTLAWCEAHGAALSLSRIQGLVRQHEPSTRGAFHVLAATLRERGGPRWPGAEAQAWPVRSGARAPGLPLERPSLLRFRMRALCGVGARADVLCALLARQARWTTASDLSGEGYSKRAVGAILAELAGAGLATPRPQGNRIAYRLRDADLLTGLTSAHRLALPDWNLLLSLVLRLLQLDTLAEQSAPVRRIEANACRTALELPVAVLGLAPLPVTRGNPRAWDDLHSWASGTLEAIANGSSPALTVSV